MAMQVLNNKYSKKNVNEYVDKLLGEKNEITSREIVIGNDDDYIMTLLSADRQSERARTEGTCGRSSAETDL